MFAVIEHALKITSFVLLLNVTLFATTVALQSNAAPPVHVLLFIDIAESAVSLVS